MKKLSDRLGPVMLDLRGTTLAPDEEHLLAHPQVGGLILFSRNYESLEQLSELILTIRAERPDIVIAVDQEGGRVQRFRKGFTRLPPMQHLGRLCEGGESAGLQLARDCGWLMASELLSAGLDMSFAPVLDIDASYSKVIGDRSFSPESATVIAAAQAFIRGMHDAGMASTGKHFPGHGSVVADSHLELPVDHRSLSEIEAHDLKPFRALVDELDAVMPAHLLIPAVDSNPVGFSRVWLQDILRQELQFDGVIFSDDLSMAGAACAGGFPERARLALEAGCDVALVCNNQPQAQAVLDDLGVSQIDNAGRLARMRARVSPAQALAALAGDRAYRTRLQLAQLENKAPQ